MNEEHKVANAIIIEFKSGVEAILPIGTDSEAKEALFALVSEHHQIKSVRLSRILGSQETAGETR